MASVPLLQEEGEVEVEDEDEDEDEDDDSDTNPVLYLRRLDEFIKLRNVPKSLELTVAYKSIIGYMSKQWVEAVSRNLAD